MTEAEEDKVATTIDAWHIVEQLSYHAHHLLQVAQAAGQAIGLPDEEESKP